MQTISVISSDYGNLLIITHIPFLILFIYLFKDLLFNKMNKLLEVHKDLKYGKIENENIE